MTEFRGKEQRQQLNYEIGKRCREARLAANLTQEKLSELLDVNSQFISDVERGRVGVSLLTLRDLSETLGVSTDYLIKGSSCASENKLTLGNRCINLSDSELPIMEQGIDAILKAFKIFE